MTNKETPLTSAIRLCYTIGVVRNKTPRSGKMKAKELIKRLRKMIAENGNQDFKVLLMDHESGWFDTVVDMKVVMPNKFNALMSPGIELVQGEF